MITKKGKRWAISCVVISTTVLTGVSTSVNVRADRISESGTEQVHGKAETSDILAVEGETETATRHVTKNTITAADDFPTGDTEASKRLGIASHFHVFANEATLANHCNGNLAVGYLKDTHAFGTNIKEGNLNYEVYYIQNFDKILESAFVSQTETRKNKVVFGENAQIDFDEGTGYIINGLNLAKLTKGEVHQDEVGHKYIDFESEFAMLRGRSEELSKKTPAATISSSYFTDENKRVIDIEEIDATPNEFGQIVINLSADVLEKDRPLTIKGLSPNVVGDDVIINVDTGGNGTYVMNSPIKLIDTDGNERGNQESEYFDNNHLLWNFVNGNEVFYGDIIMDATLQGGVLAPGAFVTVNHNLDGNIIADKVVINGESHRWDFGNTGDPKYPNEIIDPDIEPEPEPDPKPEP